MNNNSFKILGIGSPIVDLLARVDDSFITEIKGAKGGMELISYEEQVSILSKLNELPVKATGGSAGNTILGISRLGVPTTFLGKLGQDEEGEFYRTQFKNYGVSDRSFRFDATQHTGCCLSLVTPDSERTMRTFLGAASTLTVEDVCPEDFEGITHVHLEGYIIFNQALFKHILQLAYDAECTISLDLASFEIVRANKELLLDVLKSYVDIVFANEDEAKEFSSNESWEEGFQLLSSICRTTCVKLGKKGAIIKDLDETVNVPCEGNDSPAIDTTGAGDFWAAGFLYGYLNNYPISECGYYASLLGGEVVKIIGTSIPEEKWQTLVSKITED